MVEFEDDENIRGRPNWVDGFDVEGPLNAESVSDGVVFANQYSTFSDAKSDVPNGGLLYLPAQKYDISDYGRLVIDSNDQFAVKGELGDGRDGYGTRLVNTGSDRVTSGPVVEIDHSGQSDPRRKQTIEGLYVRNDASTTGYKFKDVKGLKAHNLVYDTDDNSQTSKGFVLKGDTFGAKFSRCSGTSRGDVCWEIDNNGGGVELISCAAGEKNGNYAGYVIKSDECKLYGGESSTVSVGYEILGNHNRIHSPRIESADTAIKFGDSGSNTTCERSGVFSPYMASMTTDLVLWDDSDRCYVDMVGGRDVGSTTNGYHFGASTFQPMIRVDRTSAARSLTDDGATNPYVEFAFNEAGPFDGNGYENMRVAGTTAYGRGDEVLQTADTSGHWHLSSGYVSGSYTGDGKTGRKIQTGYKHQAVIVIGSDGTVYDAWDGLSESPGIFGTAPAGDLYFSYDGFFVDDGGGDSDPNTSNESYSYMAW